MHVQQGRTAAISIHRTLYVFKMGEEYPQKLSLHNAIGIRAAPPFLCIVKKHFQHMGTLHFPQRTSGPCFPPQCLTSSGQQSIMILGESFLPRMEADGSRKKENSSLRFASSRYYPSAFGCGSNLEKEIKPPPLRKLACTCNAADL